MRRFRYNDYYKHEFETMIQIADVIIVHNCKMAQYFIENGVPEKKLVTLEIFDYLQKLENRVFPEFKKADYDCREFRYAEMWIYCELANLKVSK